MQPKWESEGCKGRGKVDYRWTELKAGFRIRSNQCVNYAGFLLCVSSYSDLFCLTYFSPPHSFSVRPTDLHLTVGKAMQKGGGGGEKKLYFDNAPPSFSALPRGRNNLTSFLLHLVHLLSLSLSHTCTHKLKHSCTRRIMGPWRDQPQSAPGNESIDSSSFNILFCSFFLLSGLFHQCVFVCLHEKLYVGAGIWICVCVLAF